MGPSSGDALNVGPYPTPNAAFVHVLAPVSTNWLVEHVPLPKDPFPSGPKEPGPVPNQNRKH